MNLDQLATPCLLLDRARMQRNLAAMATRIGDMGASLRPHPKTHKSVDVLRDVVATGHVRGITVSTLAQAAHFRANEEHGMLSGRDCSIPNLAIGDPVRIWPNHACAMTARHGRYHVVHGADW